MKGWMSNYKENHIEINIREINKQCSRKVPKRHKQIVKGKGIEISYNVKNVLNIFQNK